MGPAPGARTPGLVPPSVRCRLTARELEVALAAASGLSSKEIAARLSLAVRTVGNHLQRIYTKLEVSDRTALGGVIHGSAAGPVGRPVVGPAVGPVVR